MSINGTYYLRKWVPNAELVHGPLDPSKMPPPPPEGPGGPPPGGPGGGHKCDVEVKDYGQPPENFFEGDALLELQGEEGKSFGKLSGTCDGNPIKSGFYTNDNYFKVTYNAGPGIWEVWAHVDEDGYIEGVVSVGNGGGFPNLCYGKKL